MPCRRSLLLVFLASLPLAGGAATWTLVGNVPVGAPLGASTNTATVVSTTAGTATTEHLHPLANHVQFRPLLAILFPSVQLQSPFNQD